MKTVIQLYQFLLQAYPAAFYKQFGDEMASVFADQLNEDRTYLEYLSVILREFSDLGVNIMREQWAHYQQLRQTNPKAAQVMATNFIYRVFTIAYAVFFLWLSYSLFQRGDFLNGLVTVVFESILLVGVLIGWRWRATGAIITLTSAVTLTVVTMAALNAVLHNIILSALGALLWTLPGFAFGIMLVLLFRNTRKIKHMA
ncbi:MAG: hypothetical protein H6670_18675 [Anaerolineaceae bacterium]|nr:hypothetical protein [Anaerolineaceae bacterium]